MYRVALLLLCLPLCASSQRKPRNTDSLRVLRQAQRDIAVLCSDSMAGRGVVGGGQLRAAQWLAGQFQALGLHSMRGGVGQIHADYLQPFNYELNVHGAPELLWNGRSLRVGVDYILAAESGPAQHNKPVRVWDGGHGLPTDWQRILHDPAFVQGHWVAIRPGLPAQHGLPDSLARQWAQEGYKLRLAYENNARGGVLLLQSKLTRGLAPYAMPIPVVQLHDSIFGSGTQQVQARWTQTVEQPTGHNVIGVWPGRSDSCIVVGAHYDHLGKLGSAIFRGASDNASGTAWLLALARRVVAHKQKLPYTVVFIAFGAEEAGLIGSFHYVKNPWRGQLVLTRYMLNLDLMAFGEKGWMAVGGVDYPQLYAHVQALNQGPGWVAPLRSRRNAPISDHYPFTQMGVPALFFYTEGGPGFYHDVSDKPETLGYAAFYRSLRLVERLLTE